MLRFRTLAVAGAAALGLAGAVVAGPAGPASAAGDPEIGKQVLDLLCASKSGTPFVTPFHQSLPGGPDQAGLRR